MPTQDVCQKQRRLLNSALRAFVQNAQRGLPAELVVTNQGDVVYLNQY